MGWFDEIIQPDVSEALEAYPDASNDLVKHYVASKLFRDLVGEYGSLGIGLFKEVIDGTMGESAGKFSVDDLGADWAGATGMSLAEANDRGLFNHTEDWYNQKGYGQGDYRQVRDKLRN